jgi:hypothetical protein
MEEMAPRTRTMVAGSLGGLALTLVVLALVKASSGQPHVEDTASYSANTNQLVGVGATGGLSKDDLRIQADNDGRFPLLLPTQLPPGNTIAVEFLGTISRDWTSQTGSWLTSYYGNAELTTDGVVATYEVYQAVTRPGSPRCIGQEQSSAPAVGCLANDLLGH